METEHQVHKGHEYDREVSLSLETFRKYRKKKIRRFDVRKIVAGWYKIGGDIRLHRENGGFTDQLIFQQDNPHYKLQGYVFKVG